MPTATVAFINGKGGAGKTTTLVTTAQALAHKGAGIRVGICDLDLNQFAANWVRAHPHEMLTVLSSINDDDDSIALRLIDTEGRSRVEQSLAVLPRHVSLFIVPCGPSALELEAAQATVAAIKAKRPDALIRLLWNRINAVALSCRPEALAANAKLIGAEALRGHLDRSTAFENARLEGWGALKTKHRDQVLSVAMEILSLLLK